jgi:hypothetical protein
MSVTTITPSQAWQGQGLQLHQDFTALGKALQAGNLSAAQQAYAALLQPQGSDAQAAAAGYSGGSFSGMLNLLQQDLDELRQTLTAVSPSSMGQGSSNVMMIVMIDQNGGGSASSSGQDSVDQMLASLAQQHGYGSQSQPTQPASQGSGQAESLDSAMSALEQDLQQDNLGLAQQDFEQLQQALQAVEGQRHHHQHHCQAYGDGGSYADPSGSNTLSATS